MKSSTKLEEVLRDFVFVRRGKHLVYRHKATGKALTVSFSPSDRRAVANIARDARRASR